MLTTKSTFSAKLAFAFSLFMLSLGFVSLQAQSKDGEFTLGVIADCQFANQANKGSRHYTSCPGKLASAVKKLNNEPLQGVLHLGDFIDKDVSSFSRLLPITKALTVPFYHVLGNHEFSIEDDAKDKVTEILNMPARYYSFAIEQWRFIALDGNDVSTYGWPSSTAKHQQNMKLFSTIYRGHETWNGAIGDEQITWLTQQLNDAEKQKQKVVLLSHFPIFPEDPHNLWNAEQILEIVSGYPHVKAWFNGHNHTGNYAKYKHIHFVTFHAMLDTPETAYSLVNFTANSIEVEGIGRQPNLSLPIGKTEE